MTKESCFDEARTVRKDLEIVVAKEYVKYMTGQIKACPSSADSFSDK
jgi:hypothetical protein